MKTNLMQAHRQWADRPADERFQSLQQLHTACSEYREASREATLSLNKLRVAADGEEVKLIGQNGSQAKLTNWAMGQLCTRAKAPASYLRSIPATLAAQNLNHGLKENGEDTPAKLLFHTDATGLTLKASLTDSYTRIWNSDITRKLLMLQANNPNWTNPKAYAVKGAGGFSAIDRDKGMVPSGLYASDRDMFAFLVDESKTLNGSPLGLNRGFFVWNSEVGAKSFGIMAFLYDRICGNNIVWGANNITEVKIRHVGQADDRVFGQIQQQLRKYVSSSAQAVEQGIERAKGYQLGVDKALALETLVAMASKFKLPELTETKLLGALDVAERRQDRYGDPRTLWAAVSGLTEASQDEKHIDTRMGIDRAAGKLLKAIDF